MGLSQVCAAAASAFVAGVTSGSLGAALRAGITSFITAAAFQAVGDLTGGLALDGAPDGGHAPLDFMSEAHLFNIAGHALVGCVSAVMGGGKCGPGALSAAAGSFAGPLVGQMFPDPQHNTADLFGGTVASAVVGGVASVAGGGMFANGAVTAAFGYLFNSALPKKMERSQDNFEMWDDGTYIHAPAGTKVWEWEAQADVYDDLTETSTGAPFKGSVVGWEAYEVDRGGTLSYQQGSNGINVNSQPQGPDADDGIILYVNPKNIDQKVYAVIKLRN
jgi:hypothetical protein